MATVVLREERDNQSYLGEVLDLSAKQPTPQFSREEIEAARMRNRARHYAAKREDQVEHMLEEYRTFGLLRERANQWQSTSRCEP